ncbi:MAG: Ldh family oxidoreductase [Ignavibacteria bacterium]|nr:Ldh family oxidoreductase [Ignavibacteria bacterium]MBI3766694.1 Ldh family oxidoreductase [Ignavibacteriales bacterium]
MITISKDELELFATDLLLAAKSSREDAELVAHSLVWADLRGRQPQGVFRIPVLVTMIHHGLITSPTEMNWSKRSEVMYHLDAGNGFGQVAGYRAMQKAIDIAKKIGIGMVTVNRSNHFGAASYFCALAADAQCVGLTFTNATPKVAPFGGTKPILGTNPVAFGCPTSSGVPILVDFSTSSIAGSTIRTITEGGGRLPKGVALDASGQPTTDPAALSSGCLLPAAGAKGYGLGLMIEIFCGILAGAGMSHEVGPFYSTWKRPVNSGHMMMAIDISRLQPLDMYFDRLDQLIKEIKSSPTLEHVDEVLIPGEVRGRFADQFSREGIPLNDETIHGLENLARSLAVEVPWKQAAPVSVHDKQ